MYTFQINTYTRGAHNDYVTLMVQHDPPTEAVVSICVHMFC